MRRVGFLLPLLFLFLLSFLFESSILSFPLFLIFGLAAINIKRSFYTLILLFLGGLVLDSLRGVGIGSTPFFISATMLVLLLYEKYFGVRHIMVIIVICLTSVVIYSFLLSYSLMQLVIGGIIFLIIIVASWLLIKKGVITV